MSGKGAKGLSGKGAKGTMGDKKGDKKKPVSRSARAGLQFPVGRIHRLLKVRGGRGRLWKVPLKTQDVTLDLAQAASLLGSVLCVGASSAFYKYIQGPRASRAPSNLTSHGDQQYL